MEIHQTQVHEWLDQNKEILISEFTTNPDAIYPWAMKQLSEWESDKETPHETTCQMYEYLLQTLETFVELPPSLSSKEVWKSGESIGLSRYEISNQGNVRNNVTRQCLSGCQRYIKYHGYNLVADDKKKVIKSTHRLVAMLFIPNPENKKSVDHINRIQNDNRCLNLRWATLSEQAFNRKKKDSKYYAVYQYDQEGNLVKKWNSAQEASSELTINYKILSGACSRGLIYHNYQWYYDYLVEVDETEVWKPSYLEDHEAFEISSKGRIRRANGKIHNGNENEVYRSVRIWNLITKKYGSFAIHILVATAFFGKHEGFVVNHKNGNKHDNNIENLEFVTQSENALHAHRTGLVNKATKAVRQIDPKTSNIIAEYKSVCEASRLTNVNKNGISAVCQGVQDLAGGYKWTYIDDGQNQKERISKSLKPVRQLDKDTGEIIEEFPSAKIAALKTGIGYASIGNVCRGYYNTTGGFRWEYI